MVASALSAGAETSTRLAPAVRCAEALSLAVKMPVHSSAISTPSSFQGSLVGSRSAETLILPLPRLIESPSTVTVPGKRPCTESKRNRWALVSTGPRSLMATTSISRRLASKMARRTLRPIRPNPLIATRIAIQFLLKGSRIPCFAVSLADSGANSRPERTIVAMHHNPERFDSATSHSGALQALCRSLDHGRGSDAEMRIKILGRSAGAEAVHADEDAVRPDHRVPAEPDRGLDRDLDRGVADDRLALRLRLLQQQIERRHRHHPCGDAGGGKLLLGGDGDFDLRARRIQRHLGLAFRCDQFIAAMAAQIVGAGDRARGRQVLPRQR